MATYTLQEVYRGDTYDGDRFQVLKNGTPVNLTGVEIFAQFRPANAANNAALTLEIGKGITLVDAATGWFQFDPAVRNIEPAIYVFDVEFVFSETERYTLIDGTQKIKQDVTRL
jgi:hypothetical protein